jgi:trehalose transport system permease protein
VLLVLPLFLYLLVFTALPLLSCVLLSFTDAASHTLLSWDNYLALFSSGQFGQAFRNTLWLTGLGVCLEVLLGLAMAHVLHHLVRGRAVVRTLVLTPLGIPTIVVGVMFAYLFGSTGYMNEFLYRLGVLDTPIDWLAGTWQSFGVLLLAELWKVTPVVTLILLAGLESIPDSAFEAAAVDGAGGWSRFWYVTLPLLRPSLTIAIVLRAIDAFRIFELPLLLTGKSLPVLGTLAYSEYYEYGNPFTSAAAASLLLGMIALGIGGYLCIMARRQEGTV